MAPILCQKCLFIGPIQAVSGARTHGGKNPDGIRVLRTVNASPQWGWHRPDRPAGTQPFRQVLMNFLRSSPLSSLLPASLLQEVIFSC